MPKSRNLADHLRAVLAKDADLANVVEDETLNADIAEAIYAARKKAGLAQSRLAALIGTSQSVIARLESADYEGHSLSLLKRIAHALGRRLQINFYSKDDGRASQARELQEVQQANWVKALDPEWAPKFCVRSARDDGQHGLGA